MEVSAWLQLLCGNFWLVVKAGYLVNKIGMARVDEFGDILGETSVYTKVGDLLDSLMGSVSKAMMDDLSSKVMAHAVDTC